MEVGSAQEEIRAFFRESAKRFSSHFLQFAQESSFGVLTAADQPVSERLRQLSPTADRQSLIQFALRSIAQEYSNLMSALEWLAAEGTNDKLMELVEALGEYWRMAGFWNEFEYWMSKALEAARDAGDRTSEAAYLYELGWLFSARGNQSKSQEYLERSLELWPEDQASGAAWNRLRLAGVYKDEGNLDKAQELLESARSTFTQLAEKDGLSAVYISQGDAFRLKGDLDRAESLFKEAISLCQSLDDPLGLSTAYHNLALGYYQKDDLDQALKYLEMDLALSQHLGDNQALAHTHLTLGILSLRREERQVAWEHLEYARQAFETLGDLPNIASTCRALGDLWDRTGNWPQALDAYKQAVGIYERTNERALARLCNALGDAFNQREDWKEAAEWHNRAATVSARLGDQYADRQEWKRAIEEYQFARGVTGAEGDPYLIAFIELGQALAHSALGEIDSEIQCYMTALNAAQQTELPEVLGQVNISLGNANREKHEWAEALHAYEAARKAFEQAGSMEGLVSVNRNLGFTYLESGYSKQALEHFQHAAELAHQMGDENQEADIQAIIDNLISMLAQQVYSSYSVSI